MKTLFLHPPSFDGFDGGAGSRYQARREIRSFWYPTWRVMRFAMGINPHTIQVSLAAPYPGTELYRQAVANGWLAENHSANLVNDQGIQLSPISYPHLSAQEIFHGVETFYRRFYFRPRKIGEMLAEMMKSWDLTRRRLREGVEFYRFLRAHEA